ncbi:MAG: Ku protein [Myxococcaceae bacterium]|nr:Ku protein [Myxococcaceae bacterium]
MAARASGSGTISFGLVNIPVKLYSASDSSGKISFNQLHADKKIRLKQQMIDPETGEPVPREKIVKGYEYAKDQYLIINEDELEKLELATSRSMDITEFVPLAAVDPLYFESGNYLAPEKGAERAYALLVKGLEDMKHAAIAKYVARGKMHLILIRPLGNALVLQYLRYADEVKALSEIPVPEAKISDAELGLARQFISSLAKPSFDINQYKDEYRERLKDLLDRKVKGESVDLTPAPAPQAKVVDLMEALKASLARTGAMPAAPAPPAAAPAPTAPPDDDERKPPRRSPKSDEVAEGEATRKKKAKS